MQGFFKSSPETPAFLHLVEITFLTYDSAWLLKRFSTGQRCSIFLPKLGTLAAGGRAGSRQFKRLYIFIYPSTSVRIRTRKLQPKKGRDKTKRMERRKEKEKRSKVLLYIHKIHTAWGYIYQYYYDME